VHETGEGLACRLAHIYATARLVQCATDWDDCHSETKGIRPSANPYRLRDDDLKLAKECHVLMSGTPAWDRLKESCPVGMQMLDWLFAGLPKKPGETETPPHTSEPSPASVVSPTLPRHAAQQLGDPAAATKQLMAEAPPPEALKTNATMSDKDDLFLVAMLELGASAPESCKSLAKIASRAEGTDGRGGAAKEAAARLKARGLIDSVQGSKGGMYLTPEGRIVAERLANL
jgi:hypothetical protein